MFIAVLFIIARTQTGCVGCPELDTTEVIYHTQHAQDMEAASMSIDRWMDEAEIQYSMEYYSAIKKNEFDSIVLR